MSDFERLIKSSLEEVGGGFEPKDTHEARRRFLEARRRRRITGFVSGLAVAGVAVAAILFAISPEQVGSPNEDPRPGIAAAVEPLEVSQEYTVGSSPVGLTVDVDGGVWVANFEDSSVSFLGAGAKEIETIALPSKPEDVATTDSFVYAIDGPGGAAAAEGLTGSATLIDRTTGRLADRDNPDDVPDGARAQLFLGSLEEGEGNDLGHIDIATSEDAVWAASAKEDGVFLTTDEGEGRFFEVPSTGEVATLDGIGFALDSESSTLFRLDPDPSSEAQPLPLPAEVQLSGSSNLDMTGGLGGIWLTQAGRLYRLDPETGDLTASIELEGADYAAVATGEGFVWVLEGYVDGSLGGRLLKIDPDLAEIVGEPLILEGKLADVAAGGGSVWVTNKSAGTLIKIDPSRP